MSLFENTLKQIEKAANIMKLTLKFGLFCLCRSEKSSLVFVRMDDGSLKIFKGFRVQHNNAAGLYREVFVIISRWIKKR